MNITETTVRAVPSSEREQVYWDDALKGFGLRVHPSGVKVFVVQYRTSGGRRGTMRKMTVGRYGAPLTVDMARREAQRLLSRAKLGDDPAMEKRKLRADLTVAELCDAYFKDGCTHKKGSTLLSDKGRVERHIKPLLGRLGVSAVTRLDIERFVRDVAKGKTQTVEKTGKRGKAVVRGGKGAATRSTGLLGAIFTYAVTNGLRSDNPVRGVRRFPDGRSQRFLSAEEWRRLGVALMDAERAGANPYGVAVLRLLAFTGMRKNEAAHLRWREVNLERGFLSLETSKTGPKVVTLGAPAKALLTSLSGDARSEWVFPNASGKAPYGGLVRLWQAIRLDAGLEDVRLHDLRHSFASHGLGAGAGLPIIGALLGQASASTTARYAHLAADPVRAAADRIAVGIERAMAPSNEEKPAEARQMMETSSGFDRNIA